MIFPSTLVLALAISTVPAAIAAPIGRRNLDVRAMRRSMETAPAPIQARAEHHSARSYVPGGRNDPEARADSAGNSDVNKREDAGASSTWRRERPKDTLPRHVRDAIPRKRATEPAVEARHPDEEHHPHPGKPDQQKQPDDSNPTPENGGQQSRREVEARHDGHGGGKPGQQKQADNDGQQNRRDNTEKNERRGPIGPIAAYKRALESLD